MLCSLNSENGKKAIADLAIYLSNIMSNIASTPGASFNVEQLMKEMYTAVYNSTKDHERAIGAISMIPALALRLTTSNSKRMATLMGKGLSLDTLGRHITQINDEVNGAKYIEQNILGLSDNVEKDLQDQQVGHNTSADVIDSKINSANKKDDVEDDSPVDTADDFVKDPDTGEVEIDEEPVEVEEEEINDKGETVRVTRVSTGKFVAVADTALKDTDNEALSMKEDHPDYNVIDPNPLKRINYNVKRNIVRLLKTSEIKSGSAIDYPGVGRVYLRAQSKSTIPADRLLEDTNEVVGVVVDANGNPVTFDNEGNFDPNGNVAFFNLSDPYEDNEGLIEVKRISRIMQELRVSKGDATRILQSTKDQMKKIREHVLSSPERHTVLLDITGGTLGYMPSQKERYTLSKIKLNGSSVKFRRSTEQEKAEGAPVYFMTVPDVSPNPIGVFNPEIRNTPEMIEYVVELLTNPVQFVKSGQEMTLTNKRDLILDKIFFLSASFKKNLEIKNNELYVFGEKLDPFDSRAKDRIRAALTSPIVLTPLNETEVKELGGNVVDDISKVTKTGDILKITDPKSKVTTYVRMGFISLTINKSHLEDLKTGTNTSSFYTIEKNVVGEYVVTETDYVQDYVFKYMQADKMLNGNDELVLLNAYLTFKPMQFEAVVLDGSSISNETPSNIGKSISKSASKSKTKKNQVATDEFQNALNTGQFDGLTKEQALEALNEVAKESGLNKAQVKKLTVAINRRFKPIDPIVNKNPNVGKSIEAKKADIIAKYEALVAERGSYPGGALERWVYSDFLIPSIAQYFPSFGTTAEIVGIIDNGGDGWTVEQQIDSLISERKLLDKLRKASQEELELFLFFINNLIRDKYIAATKEKGRGEEGVDNQISAIIAINEIAKSFLETDVDVTSLISPPSQLPATPTDEAITNVSDEIQKIDPDTFTKDDDADDIDPNAFFKLNTQINPSEVLTAKEFDEAREWFKNSPLGKVEGFTFEEAYNMVNQRNKNSVAQWTRNGIILFKGSNLTDLYHEAFHQFTQGWMTPAQRKELYDAVRDKKGTFVTYEGKKKSFADATDKEAEEFLAEDFRKWMLAGAKMSNLDKSSPKISSFFKKLWNILKSIFGKSDINDIVSGDKSNEFIEEIYNKLATHNLSGYSYSADNLDQGFDVLYKGPSALNSDLPINKQMPYLNEAQTQILMDSMDSWIGDFMAMEMANLSSEQAMELFNQQIQMTINPEKFTAEEIESAKMKLSPSFNYGKIAYILKTKEGRQRAYRHVQHVVGALSNAYVDKRQELLSKKTLTEAEKVELERVTEAGRVLYWAWNNFGNAKNLEANKQMEDGRFMGVLAFHQSQSKAFSTKAIEDLDLLDEQEGRSRSEYADRSGNETSLYELAKERAEVKYIFHTIKRINPETGLPYMNDYGAAELMDWKEVWNKVALILENTKNPTVMYNKLLKFAKSDTPTEMTYAVAQIINKLGPKGLDRSKFAHLNTIAAENVWTSFWNIFSNTRVALYAMTATIEKKGDKFELESRIGRGINPNARVAQKWDTDYRTNVKRDNTYRVVNDLTGVTVMNLPKIKKDFQDIIDKVEAGKVLDLTEERVLEFFSAIGIEFTNNKNVREALRYGDPTNEVRPDFHVLKTLFSKNPLGSKTSAQFAKGERMSFFDVLIASDAQIETPSDLFSDRYDITIKILSPATKETIEVPVNLKGEKSNLNDLLTIEAYHGSGIPTFMATTADGNTQFEHTLPSTLSTMVTDINDVEEYDQFLELPHLRHLHFKHNPSAKNYWWLKQMFELDLASPNYGKRKIVNNVKVALKLINISGAKADDLTGVASAKADEFTKFIMDIHLITQVGLPELMRHSDKSTSYSVTLNISELENDEWTRGALYVPNNVFLDKPKKAFQALVFNQHIIPNLDIELTRIVRLKKKKEEIIATLKRIKEQKKKGLPVESRPVFDIDFLNQGVKFLTFQGILNSGTKTELLDKFTDFYEAKLAEGVEEYNITLKDFFASNRELENLISEEVGNYFDKLEQQTLVTYKQSNGVIAKNLIDVTRSKLTNEAKKDITVAKIEEGLLRSYTYNTWIHNAESLNIIYGSPAAYDHAKEDFHKRNAGVASTGNGYRVDQDMIDTINNTLQGRMYENQFKKNHSGKNPPRAYDGTLSVGVMKDKVTKSVYFEEIGYNLYKQELERALRSNNRLPKDQQRSKEDIDERIKTKLFGSKYSKLKIENEDALSKVEPARGSIMRNYFEMKEADAQGWISMDAYRILAFSQGEWTPAHENMYKRLLSGEELDQAEVKLFFPPLKTQYWGPLKTDFERIDAFHKFQLTPIVPSLAAVSPKLKQLNDKMMREGIDYVLFKSGSKMGTLSKAALNDKNELVADIDNIYDNDTREIHEDNEFTVNTIFVNYLKNQLKIAPKFKGKSTFPSQIRKIIETGLMENGVPTDFMPNSTAEERKEKWDNLSPAEKLKSENWHKILKYETSIQRLATVKRKQLFVKAKLKYNSSTGEVTGDRKNIVEFIKARLTDEEIADHELNFITDDPNLDLSYSLSSKLIETILNALVIKSIVRQKVNGEALVQVSGAMIENEPQFKKPTKEKIKQYGGTNGLTFYRHKEGDKIIESMKVKIALQGDFVNLLYRDDVAVYDTIEDKKNPGKFIVALNENESLKKLNSLIKDESWLKQGNNRKLISIHGVRIPTQSKNADVAAEVYEFLPKEAGNIIILPAEIVAQSGGDYDIDKLTLQFPNIFRKRNDDGSYEVDLYSFDETLDKSKLDKRYDIYKRKLAEDLILGEENKHLEGKSRRDFLAFMATGSQKFTIQMAIDELEESGELMSREDFILDDLEKGAQNDVMFSMLDIIKSPSSYLDLIRPNGIDIMEPIIESSKKTFRGYTPKTTTNNEELGDRESIQVTRILEPIYNLFKHYTNNSAKAGVGMGAIEITYNELFNRIGMYLTPNNRELNKGFEYSDEATQEAIKLGKEILAFSDTKKLKEQRRKTDGIQEKKDLKKGANADFYFLTDAESKLEKELREKDKAFNEKYGSYVYKFLEGFTRQTLYLPHNTIEVSDAKGNKFKDKAISLSHTADVFGENQIADTLSQLENGWLDAAKDPWIFYLRGNQALTPHLLFLVEAGVPIEFAVEFISQPIILEFTETISKLQSQFGRLMNIEGAEGITKQEAKLRAKAIILKKLGYNIDIKKIKSEDLNKLISREILLNEPTNGEFTLEELRKQNEYVQNKYKLFNNDGTVNLDNVSVDFTDPVISTLQKQVLLHFLQVSDMQDSIRDVKLKTNVDTNPSKTLVSSNMKVSALKELKRTDQKRKGQDRYWRIPAAPIEKLIPTIKKDIIDEGKKVGVEDTGRLDESNIQSPIGAFYVQPIQNMIWGSLFPLKMNPVINKFFDNMDFATMNEARKETYFEKDEEIIEEFKNSLIPIVFQNEFLAFDTRTLLTADTIPVTYRGSEVRVEKATALPEVGVVVKFEKGQPVLYFDYNTLYNQYESKAYAKDNYGGELNLSKLSVDHFPTFGEYVKFVFEREYIRAVFADLGGKKSINKLFDKKTGNPKALDLYQTTKDVVSRAEKTDSQIEKERKRLAFEQFITNTALENTFNMYALFQGNTAYANEIAAIKINPKFKKLLAKFSLFSMLTPNGETTKGGKKRLNLTFVESVNEKNDINSYYEQVNNLSNSKVLSDLNITHDLGLDREDILHIESIFQKLPIVAFLQTGMESSGRSSLTRIVDPNIIRIMTQDAVDKFIADITEESQNSENGSSKTLTEVWNAFIRGNERFDLRGKHFVIERTKSGDQALSLENAILLEDVAQPGTSLFDPTYVEENGYPSNGYLKTDDELKVGGTKANVTDVVYEEGFIVVKASNKFGEYIIKYDVNGRLVSSMYPYKGKTQTSYSSDYTDFRPSPLFVKSIIGGEEITYTEVGDVLPINYKWKDKSGKIGGGVYDATVTSIEDIGYPYDVSRTSSDTNRYLITLEIPFGKGTQTRNLIVDVNGNILGQLDLKGNYQDISDVKGSMGQIRLKGGRLKPSTPELVFDGMAEYNRALSEGRIPVGEVFEVVEPHEKYKSLQQSTLFIIDSATREIQRIEDPYEDPFEEPVVQQVLENKKRFVVYNAALNPADSLPQERGTGTSINQEKIDLADKRIHHGDFNLKIGITTRKKYGGGVMQELFEDDYDYVTETYSVNPEVKVKIDEAIDAIKEMIDAGYTPIFNKSGYGQYLIGANDDTGKMYKQFFGESIAKGVETFKYLSKKLLEVGFVNPNFVKHAEGTNAIVEVVKQPVSEQDIVELMKKCFI